MHFAVIGDTAEAIFLIETVSRSAEHDLAACCVAGALAAEMNNRSVGFRLTSSPEEAIVDAEADVIIVAYSDTDHAMAMTRQASQAGQHVVVIPPQVISTAFSFELHLLLDESEHGIVPFLGRWYVRADRSSGALADAEVRQLTLNLPLTADAGALQRLQLHGVDAISGCGYRFSQVTGLDVRGADDGLISRSITLSSSAASENKVPPAVVSFSADCSADQDARLVVTQTDGGQEMLDSALPFPEHSEKHQDSQPMLNRLCQELSEPDSCQRRMEDFSSTLELMAGLEKSLRRRRTVDVYFDGVSERSAFKTQMTAIGCGVLTYVTFGLITLAMAQALGLPATLLKIGMFLWIAPVVLFLLAQLLLPLARDRDRRDDRETRSP